MTFKDFQYYVLNALPTDQKYLMVPYGIYNHCSGRFYGSGPVKVFGVELIPDRYYFLNDHQKKQIGANNA